MEIFLNKNQSKKNVNVDNLLQVSIGGRQKLLPMENIVAPVSSYEQYVKERQECQNIRLITTINPVCSNILYNHISEIVYKEGSDEAQTIDVNQDFVLKGYDNKEFSSITECIRDTQLTRFDDVTLHCGVDIFNNHILRSETFKSVCQKPKDLNTFNTIREKMRTFEGKNVQDYSDNREGIETTVPNLDDTYLYDGSDILSFENCVKSKLVEENGWVGFYNASKMKTYSGKSYDNATILQISNVINNKRSCDFIHLAPEKDLFLFTPKYNKYRNRLEKNWHYYITYPSSSTTNVSFIEPQTNGLKLYKYQSLGNETTLCSISKHGLKSDDKVNIYDSNGEIQLNKVTVNRILNDWDFTIDSGSFILDDDIQLSSYKQVIQNEEVEYYVRIFSKLPNWKYEDKLLNEYTVNKQDSTLINDNQNIDFENHISNLGFGQNIYGDAITQIVFTDDINVDYIKDNLGRPLSEVYLTILKNNAGYKEWYNTENPNVSADTIEYSHVFGKLNCGFNLSVNYSKPCEGHITYMNNVKTDDGDQLLYKGLCNLNNSDDSDEVNINSDIHFYGDLCCLSRTLFVEKVIDDAMLRFNTAQRECERESFSGFIVDEIFNNISGLTFTTYGYGVSGEQTANGMDNYNSNKLSEGYYYKAHYRIPIKTYSNELESQYPDIYTIKSIKSVKNAEYKITTLNTHLFNKGDVFKLYDIQKNEYYNGDITENIDKNSFTCRIYGSCDIINAENKGNFKLIRKYETIPSYAILAKDGSCRYFWRWLLQNGFDENTTNETYPFTNDAFYINQNINFFLRRQNPNQNKNIMYSFLEKAPNSYDKTKENNYYTEGDMTC